jgi:hypothetical protein
MQMKEKICLTGLLLGKNHGCITINLSQGMLQCYGNTQFTFNQKDYGYEYAITWEGYDCCVWGFSGSTVSPFSEVW